MGTETIRARVAAILASLPANVTLVAAGKTRSPAELQAAVDAGVTVIGHNYVQEAEDSITALGRSVRWHFIGHLQRNKAKKAVELFDLIETVDSERLARALDQAAAAAGKRLPVLIEVNSGEEPDKAGALPDQVPALARSLAGCSHLRLEGLMTMGPWDPDGEKMRPHFRLTRQLFDELAGVDLGPGRMETLSMGMSDSYTVAIEEGANLVRIGTALFGSRD
jgi:pyridoxal phosphate enzyme (YggS family)